MIEVDQIVSGKYDRAMTPTLIISDTHKKLGEMIYDSRSLALNVSICVSFTLLTELLTNGIACPIGWKQPITLRYFFKRLDQYWQHQDIIFDFRAQNL